MGRHFAYRAVERPRQERQHHCGSGQCGKPKLTVDEQPKRRACCQCAIDGHAVPGHHFARTRRAYQPHSPGQSAGQQLALTKAED